ncbi:MAG: HgcAB-like fusion protein [Spirochaetia bacterium]
MKAVFHWLIAYFARWLPAATSPGLFPIGTPNPDSPVLVTANFRLTVRRVKRALRDMNLWLLVVNTNGINVWCAAAGGLFTHNRIIDAVKISGLALRVHHRQLILPALSAPGVETDAIHTATGFTVHFGPVYATDIPEYLNTGKKTEAMQRFRFGIRHRLDMYLSMNFPVYLPIAAVLAVFWPRFLPGFTILFWSAVAFLYLFLNVIPGRTGWAQALVSSAVWSIAWAGKDWIVRGNPLAHWGWLVALVGIFLLAGIDLAGTASPRKSDFEVLLRRLGTHNLGSFLGPWDLEAVALDRSACTGCGRCREICPIGVFGEPDGENRTTLRHRDACFACGACVRQCRENALSLAERTIWSS